MFIDNFKKILEKNSNLSIIAYSDKRSEYNYFLKNLSINLIIEIIDFISLKGNYVSDFIYEYCLGYYLDTGKIKDLTNEQLLLLLDRAPSYFSRYGDQINKIHDFDILYKIYKKVENIGSYNTYSLAKRLFELAKKNSDFEKITEAVLYDGLPVPFEFEPKFIEYFTKNSQIYKTDRLIRFSQLSKQSEINCRLLDIVLSKNELDHDKSLEFFNKIIESIKDPENYFLDYPSCQNLLRYIKKDILFEFIQSKEKKKEDYLENENHKTLKATIYSVFLNSKDQRYVQYFFKQASFPAYANQAIKIKSDLTISQEEIEFFVQFADKLREDKTWCPFVSQFRDLVKKYSTELGLNGEQDRQAIESLEYFSKIILYPECINIAFNEKIESIFSSSSDIKSEEINHICLVVEEGGGSGDLVGGSEMLAFLRKKFPLSKITLLSVERMKDFALSKDYDDFILLVKENTYDNEINTTSIVNSTSLALTVLSEADLVVVAPILVWRNPKVAQALKSKQRVFFAPEYNMADSIANSISQFTVDQYSILLSSILFMDNWKNRKHDVVHSNMNTGISMSKDRGVFLKHDLIEWAKGEHKKPTVFDVKTFPLRGYIVDADKLYFGYGHKYQKSFIELILAITNSKKDRYENITIIIVSEKNPFLDLIERKFDSPDSFYEINYKYYEDLSSQISEYENPRTYYKPRINIIGLKKLNHDDFNTLQKMSEPLIMSTGDQSLIEGISLIDKVWVYDLLSHKAFLFSSIIEMAKARGLIHVAMFLEYFRNQNIPLAASYYLNFESELKKEFKELNSHIIESQNIEKPLNKYLDSIVALQSMSDESRAQDAVDACYVFFEAMKFEFDLSHKLFCDDSNMLNYFNVLLSKRPK